MSKPSTNYLARKYFDKLDVDIVADAIKNKQNVLLLGPRGTGKSSLAQVAADILGIKYSYIPCHTGATAEALLGQWIPKKEGGGYQWMDGVLTSAVRHGKICLLDEVNSLRPEVAFAIHGLLDHRRELVLTEKPDENGDPEFIQAHENFGFIAAGNPFYEGVRVMNEAFRDRFAVQLVLGYKAELDVAILSRHQDNNSLSHENQVGVKILIQKLREAAQKNNVHSDISTRAILDFVENISIHTFQTARTMFIARFDDDAEMNVIRTIFNEIWDINGKAQKAVQEEAAKTPKKAGSFATPKGSGGTAELAKGSF